ncbi:hypothetical protein HGRIS_007637 [Hohenbuehelia grisea]|uniref:Aromatic amino acid beta-eliminating lyase/threonine aldolase domain-containing protein n=1 Tax=Hohenbuehelia grisea TaxID=104357 RepID=A0ABR3J5V6_9AGAR
MLGFFRARPSLALTLSRTPVNRLYTSQFTRKFTMAPNGNSIADLEAARARIAEEVKINILSENPLEDNEAKLREIGRTFISDTITVPTIEMYAYAVQSTLGDDVYFEPSTAAFEAHVAKILGKEAAVFVPSGSASNQIALRSHLLQPPHSVLCDHRSHIIKYEAGGAAYHSQAATIPVVPANGHHLTISDVKEHVIITSDVHFAPTKVIALENTLNGTIIPQEDIIAISEYARSEDIKMHLDGARLWHVAAETGIPLKELCAPFDSVSVCFSKGLGAPIGSCLAGSKDLITRARKFRKLFGGAMRQTGILAASAAYALTYNFPLLPKVHALAKKLENGLEEIGARILSRAETCMIFYDPSPLGLDYEEIGQRGSELPKPLVLSGSRLVLHIQTSEEAVNDFLALIRQLAEEKKKAGFAPQPVEENRQAYKDVYVRRVPKQT